MLRLRNTADRSTGDLRYMKALIAACMVIAAAASAFAQNPPLAMNFGAGVAVPITGLNDSFHTGWNGTLGITWNVTPTVGVQGEYAYDRLGAPERQFTISQTPTPNPGDPPGLIQSNHQVHTGTLNLIYRPQLDMNQRSRALYLLGGAGIYHRLVQLTSPSTGYTSVCNPDWFICTPTLVPVTRVIGDRSSNDFGVNVGAGLTFGSDVKLYIETRYHYVWGPTIRPEGTPVNGATQYSTNAGYFPIIFGVRW
jgi:opacity protein-like surface antigen